MIGLRQLAVVLVFEIMLVAVGSTFAAAEDVTWSAAHAPTRVAIPAEETEYAVSVVLPPTTTSVLEPAAVVQAAPSISSSTAVPAEEGLPLRIVAPSIHLDAPVVPVGWKHVVQGGKVVGTWEVADYAAGWHQSSAPPGQPGNTVISGHHNTAGEVFRYVVDLQPGDPVFLYTQQHVYTYTVVTRLILRDKGMPASVRRENARWIGTFPDVRLTLVTCWPYHTNTHRVIVIAKYNG
ncbi:MAG: sortase [Anaerolineae bacterium]|nr:sortase [Anaerolineae bacterium]MDW8071782.1 sortase [Anaerolineae bacterium]